VVTEDLVERACLLLKKRLSNEMLTEDGEDVMSNAREFRKLARMYA
jgi:hypothetical protein